MSHKHLNNLIELLEESGFQLQGSIGDFVAQIKTRAQQCVDNSSDSNMTVKDAIVLVTTAQSTILEHTDMLADSKKLYHLDDMREEEQNTTECKRLKPRNVDIDSETTMRIKDIVNALQDIKEKTEDKVSEIEQWRDSLDLELKLEQQTQQINILTKQIHEQENRAQEMYREIEILKEKESNSNHILDIFNLHMKEHESDLQTKSKEIRAKMDKIESISQDLKKNSDLISALQKEGERNMIITTKSLNHLFSKNAVMCNILQQRLSPIEKLIKAFNQDTETRIEKLERFDTLEKYVIMLSRQFNVIANQQLRHSTLGFIASDCTINGLLVDNTDFKCIERNIGNHFDPNTGVFTAPVDGLYIASLVVEQTNDTAGPSYIWHKTGGDLSWFGYIQTNGSLDEAVGTFVIWMKSGDVLCSSTCNPDCKCKHFSCFLIGV